MKTTNGLFRYFEKFLARIFSQETEKDKLSSEQRVIVKN